MCMLILFWACTAKNEYCVTSFEEQISQSFVEETESWGLEAIQADGIRVSTVDYNYDDWPDLFIRKHATSDDDHHMIRLSWLC